jgi:hypothetical protein
METETLSQTAIGEAFRVAGYDPPEDRLEAILAEAWRKWPSSRDGAGARRDFVMARLAGEMMYVLVKKWQPSALTQIIGYALNAAHLERDAGKPADGGHKHSDTQMACAPVQSSRDTGRVSVGGGQSRPDIQIPSVPANLSRRDDARLTAERRSEPAITQSTPSGQAPAAPNLTQLADKQAARGAANVATAVRLSRLDIVMIYGRSIGDCTVAQVREWAKHRETEMHERKREMCEAARDVRFALTLVANLPSGAVIRDWWKRPEEVDMIYASAEAEHAA